MGWGTRPSGCAGLLGPGAAFLAAGGAPLGRRTRVGLAGAEQFPAFSPGLSGYLRRLWRPELHLWPHGLNAAASRGDALGPKL